MQNRAVLFLCARVCADLGLTQISLFFRAHTDPTDLTDFARLMLNLTGFLWLTQISYISLIFRKIVLNLTDVWVMVKKNTDLIH